ncbi:hypothetical protein PENSPDRAFT_591972 [Peniophora sp. CONT]|nr:hypothetical protein PENSPDRAFT_591972 [Peniophora sp. CONT]
MVYRYHSREVKELVLWHRRRGYLADEDIRDVFDVSIASMYRWQDNVDKYGDVIRPRNPLQGRPMALTAPQLGSVLWAIDNDPSMFLDEIRDWVAISLDVDLSVASIQRIVSDCAYSYKLLRKTAAERDPERRADHHKYIQENILALMTEANFVRGDRYSLVGAIAVDGFVATRVVMGSVNGAEFFDFIIEEVLPAMKPFPQDKSVLLLDNCAIHKSDYLRQLVEDAGTSDCSISFFVLTYHISRLHDYLPSPVLARLQSYRGGLQC